MMKQTMYNTAEKVADVAAAGTVGAASMSWVGAANEILTLVATCVAIAVGITTLVFHMKRIKLLRKSDKGGS